MDVVTAPMTSLLRERWRSIRTSRISVAWWHKQHSSSPAGLGMVSRITARRAILQACGIWLVGTAVTVGVGWKLVMRPPLQLELHRGTSRRSCDEL